MRNQFRNNKVELRIPRLPHPLHAVLTQQAAASGVQPPPTPAAPYIAPLPRALNSTLPLLPNSTNLPPQEVKLRRGLLPRLLPPLYLKVSLLGRFLLPLPANSLPARPIPLILPFAHQ